MLVVRPKLDVKLAIRLNIEGNEDYEAQCIRAEGTDFPIHPEFW